LIIAVAGGVLAYVGGEMIVEDVALERWLGTVPWLSLAVPLLLALVVAAIGWRATRSPRQG
jgi:predicted tellurium resistance membrane protein TerC